MTLSSEISERLHSDGWRESHEPFWSEVPCFYDLAKVKTVLFVLNENGKIGQQYYWKWDPQPRPEYLDETVVELHRFKVRHSMNALIWHDHRDYRILH